MKVCGAGLNIPGSTQGACFTVSHLLCSETCLEVFLCRGSQVGEGKPGFKPKSGDAVIASVSPGRGQGTRIGGRVEHSWLSPEAG